MRRRLCDITTQHVNEQRTVTVAGVTGSLVGVIPVRDRVQLALICQGARMWTDAMPKDTEIEIEGKR